MTKKQCLGQLFFSGLILIIFGVGICSCSKPEQSKKEPTESKPQSQPVAKEKKALPLFSTHKNVPRPPKVVAKPKTKHAASSKVASKPQAATGKPAVKVRPKVKAKAHQVAKLPPKPPPPRLKPLDYYDFEVTEEKYEPYSSFTPEKTTVYWRVINSLVQTREENFKQAQIVLAQVKRKHPNAYLYILDVNGKTYTVEAAIGTFTFDDIHRTGKKSF